MIAPRDRVFVGTLAAIIMVGKMLRNDRIGGGQPEIVDCVNTAAAIVNQVNKHLPTVARPKR